MLTEILGEVGSREGNRKESYPGGATLPRRSIGVGPGWHSPGGWVHWGTQSPERWKGWKVR